MIKFLFFDYQEIEQISGFERILTPPEKHPDNPLMRSDCPWEKNTMSLYGSVIRRPDGRYQLWYASRFSDNRLYLAYAESDDGLQWSKPTFDFDGDLPKGTNAVFASPHGTALLYDVDDPREDWRYKMVTGARPSGCITAFHSPDGIHWKRVGPGPIIGTNPDCPIGFFRARDGRYVMYHRVWGYGRKVLRSESWDFQHWSSEPRLVLEPDPIDPPNTEFYGMGAVPYGPYELGTLWLYHTDPDDYQIHKMKGYQEAEMTYSRYGYAWHRVQHGAPLIPHGAPGSWDQGNVQTASRPIFLDDEIRYYYAGTNLFHMRTESAPPELLASERAGLGLTRLKPDRFVALRAGGDPGQFLTKSFRLPCRLSNLRVRVNADVQSDGWVRVGLLSHDAQEINGFSSSTCTPVTGDSISHGISWSRPSNVDSVEHGLIRLSVQARHARIYSISIGDQADTSPYYEFTEANPERNHIRL